MRKIVALYGLSLVALVLPALASAQNIGYVLGVVSNVLNALIGIFITLAIVIFFWGLIQYLVNVGEEKSKGIQIMFYGVLAIFVMVSIWGIIRLLQNTFQVGGNLPIAPRGIPYGGSGSGIQVGVQLGIPLGNYGN